MDARSDLYSVGIMLFQLLTGRIPFDADSPLAIAYAHVQEEPVAPSTINRSITPAMDALVARALKKNPNERFPSAAAMQDEIARVLSASGRTGAPVIIAGAGAPANSGSGVGSAVFPPVDQSTAAPQNVQTPYQPGPYQSQRQPGPYGPPTPAPSYGYPQSAPAYQGQAPMSPMSPMQQQTPQPYSLSQPTSAASGGGGSKRNLPVIMGSIVVALIAIGGLITVLSMKNEDKGGGTDASSSVSPAGEHRGPERNRTMDTEKCTDAMEDSDDPNKVDAPRFIFKDILSARACADAAGWTVKIIKEPGNAYAEDQVVDQFPTSGTAVSKVGAHFELKVSTGDPA